MMGLMNNTKVLCWIAIILMSITSLSCHAAARSTHTMDFGPILGCVKTETKCSVVGCTKICSDLGWNTHRCYCADAGSCCHYADGRPLN
ncbi:hypothetical protein ACQJBY_056961 [Aegilops geniculata]